MATALAIAGLLGLLWLTAPLIKDAVSSLQSVLGAITRNGSRLGQQLDGEIILRLAETEFSQQIRAGKLGERIKGNKDPLMTPSEVMALLKK